MTNADHEDVVDVPEITPVLDDEGNDTTDWKALAEERHALAVKNQGIARRFKTKLEKAKETPPATPVEPKGEPKPDDNKLLERIERVSLRQAGVEHPDDIDLARKTAKKWNMDVEEVLADEDFKVKLEKQQTSRANTQATSGVKGGAGSSQAKNTPEYWVAKGTPPTPADVPDRKVRAKIVRAMMESTKSGKKFYNE
jgi:hypothetical protein